MISIPSNTNLSAKMMELIYIVNGIEEDLKYPKCDGYNDQRIVLKKAQEMLISSGFFDKEPEPTFKIGQRFEIDDMEVFNDRSVFMLSQVDRNTYALICVKTGNRYSDPFKTDDHPSKISLATLNRLTENKPFSLTA